MFGFDPFLVRTKLTHPQARYLVFMAHTDEAVQKFTHDEIRFADVKTVRNWASERFLVVFSPRKQPQQLAALVWFSHESAALTGVKATTTMGVRVYPPFRGKGLSLALTQQAVHRALEKGFLKKGQQLWLRVHRDNAAGLALYKKLGFSLVDQAENQCFLEMKLR
jgi:GNAT superfamily N-acetyltransferase